MKPSSIWIACLAVGAIASGPWAWGALSSKVPQELSDLSRKVIQQAVRNITESKPAPPANDVGHPPIVTESSNSDPQPSVSSEPMVAFNEPLEPPPKMILFGHGGLRRGPSRY
ncbi:MAG: hypothetical protein QM755_03775 [Luteolibacter sp.]